MVYQYCICQPKKTKSILKYHTYYSAIIKKYLEASDEWVSTKNKAISHFCDHDPAGRIKCRLALRSYIFDKAVLARVLRHIPYHPPTFIIQGGRLNETEKKNAKKYLSPNKSHKWFLKPAMSCGGVGIQVLSTLNEFPQHVNPMKQYVIQRCINSILYQGKKFDIRSYILVVVSKKRVRFYLSKDSCMHISSYLYDENKLDKEINVTNLYYQKLIKTDESSDDTKSDCYRNTLSLSRWEHYQTVFPKMKEAIRVIASKLDSQIIRRNTVALLGCDFIIDQDLNPHFLEVNINIGFSIHIRPPETATMLTEMIQEIIPVGYLPLINNQIPPKESNQWIQAYVS